MLLAALTGLQSALAVQPWLCNPGCATLAVQPVRVAMHQGSIKVDIADNIKCKANREGDVVERSLCYQPHEGS